jgi:cycloartenol synthase
LIYAQVGGMVTHIGVIMLYVIGPMFLLPGFIITYYITGTPLGDDKQRELSRYLFNHQHSDGGWGLHIEEKSTMFGTVLSYISLRIMGVSESDSRLVRARALIHERGGAQSIPSWGKFWLAVLGVYDWRGTNSLFPDMWMLPTWLPMHAARYWCHCRMVYLPMSYLYGIRFVAKLTPLILSLRNEIYLKPYSEHKWESYRNLVCPHDLYTPHSKVMKFFNLVLNIYEKRPFQFVRKRALKFILDYIRAEDEQTKFVDIGPVNKAINMLAIWTAEGSNGAGFKAHVDRAEDYFWQAEDGMKVQGYNGSQLWDTAFTVQAILGTLLFVAVHPLTYHH